MSDQPPFYTPKRTTAPRQPQPREHFWGVRKDGRQLDCELRDHGARPACLKSPAVQRPPSVGAITSMAATASHRNRIADLGLMKVAACEWLRELHSADLLRGSTFGGFRRRRRLTPP